MIVNQFALGHYRQAFLDALAASGADILFLVGDDHFPPGLVTDVDSPIVRRTGRNVFLLGRRLGWQRGCMRRGLGTPVLVVELNPRNLTSWLLLLMRKALGRRTVGWGHAHSRRGPHPDHNRLRRVMQRLCDELIAYTESEAAELRALVPGVRVAPARNSLYSDSQLRGLSVKPLVTRGDFVLIGRLVEDKKPLLGVQAFCAAAPDLPPDTVLHIVGSGPLEIRIREYLAAAGMTHRVRLHGFLAELDQLAPVFERCCALLSPGYLGLNATQALGFGAVVLYARDDPHAPEVEALTEANSRDFPSDDVEACARALVDFHRARERYDSSEIAAAARAAYSTDRMIEPFLAAATRS